MIDSTAPLWRSSLSDGVSVDAWQSIEKLRGGGKPSAIKEVDVMEPNMTCRGIPADVGYIEALGRAFHHFSYLEWIAVSITAQLCCGTRARPNKIKSAGYLARKLREAMDAASPSLAPALRQRLGEFHKSFVAAKHRRDRLINAHPYMALHGLKELWSAPHQWPVHKLEAAAMQFEQAAVEGNDILNVCIQSENIGIAYRK